MELVAGLRHYLGEILFESRFSLNHLRGPSRIELTSKTYLYDNSNLSK